MIKGESEGEEITGAPSGRVETKNDDTRELIHRGCFSTSALWFAGAFRICFAAKGFLIPEVNNPEHTVGALALGSLTSLI